MEIGKPVLGAGGYGIVYTSGRNAVKLLYDLNSKNALKKEVEIQKKAREILTGIISVPEIISIQAQPVFVFGQTFLCGIEMEQIPVLEEFSEPLHMLLGYDGDDVNQSWGRSSAKDVGPENPSRGFFAGPDLLEEILAEDGLTLEGVAYTMGVAIRTLLDGGILPNDLEFIYGGTGRIYLVDFGLCEFGHADPVKFLKREGSSGIRGDIYIPQEGDRGYKEFLEGFLRLA